jgi:NAD(P)-dependent dehydrogenase (short-subunit alcohol dehydrogenase family)
MMQVSVAGKVVVITGGTQGVGAAIAVACAGADGIVLVGRDGAKGDAVAADLRAGGTPVAVVAVDLSDPAAPEIVANAALQHFGRIDALVNAAGITDRGDFLTADAVLWDRLFAVNARAPFFLMQAAIRDMRARAVPGAIVNILSMNAHGGIPELAVYSATKGALATLTKNAAHAHLADRIRVNGIMMGWAATPGEQEMQAQRLGKGDGWQATVAAGLPLGRLLTVQEVAQLALFLLSDASGLMTGTLIDMEQRVVL